MRVEDATGREPDRGRKMGGCLTKEVTKCAWLQEEK